MSDDRVQYKFQIPADLKARLEHHAIDNRRSLSAEIIERLEASLAGPAGAPRSAMGIIPPEDMLRNLSAMFAYIAKRLKDGEAFSEDEIRAFEFLGRPGPTDPKASD